MTFPTNILISLVSNIKCDLCQTQYHTVNTASKINKSQLYLACPSMDTELYSEMMLHNSLPGTNL